MIEVISKMIVTNTTADKSEDNILAVKTKKSICNYLPSKIAAFSVYWKLQFEEPTAMQAYGTEQKKKNLKSA